uniref:non-specific serine/threonine protein kinase n=1 Tax=Chaetoceros debilis TaxID=122233 RepID=A0A7S3Q9M8_9STRA
MLPGSAATQLVDDDSDDGTSDTSPKIEHKWLLEDIERLVLNDGDNDNVIQSIEQQILFDEQSRDKKFVAGAGLSAWSFEGRTSGCDDDWNQLAVHQSSRGAYDSNSISTGGYGAEDSEYSEWTVDQSDTRNRPWNFSKNSSRRPHQSSNRKDPNLGKRAENGRKWYQICLFIQMELCKPSTLADWIRNRNSTQFHNPSSNLHGRYLMSWKIFRQISKGLAHVHSKHIVHRDLKPANIFHSIEGDFFKIGDFGLSKMLKTANGGLAFESESFSCRENIVVPLKSSIDGSGGWEDPLTMGVGTSSYAAPEQLESERYGAEADVFSLGLILLELFSNFGSEHERASIFHDCRRGKLPPTLSSSSSILQDIGDLILSCTQIQPEKRPTSSSIAQIDIFSSSKVAKMQESLVVGLESKLQKKEKEIQVMAQKLRDSEFTIERQAKELRMLKN